MICEEVCENEVGSEWKGESVEDGGMSSLVWGALAELMCFAFQVLM